MFDEGIRKHLRASDPISVSTTLVAMEGVIRASAHQVFYENADVKFFDNTVTNDRDTYGMINVSIKWKLF